MTLSFLENLGTCRADSGKRSTTGHVPLVHIFLDFLRKPASRSWKSFLQNLGECCLQRPDEIHGHSEFQPTSSGNFRKNVDFFGKRAAIRQIEMSGNNPDHNWWLGRTPADKGRSSPVLIDVGIDERISEVGILENPNEKCGNEVNQQDIVQSEPTKTPCIIQTGAVKRPQPGSPTIAQTKDDGKRIKESRPPERP